MSPLKYRIGAVLVLLLFIYLFLTLHVVEYIGTVGGPSSSSSEILIHQFTGWSFCGSSKPLGNHRLAVIVPFRDRFTELQQFLPHLNQFLTNQGVRHTFYIINQVDSFKFNRGALLNVGFLESHKAETGGIVLPATQAGGRDRLCVHPPPADYVALHDVDLLPIDRNLNYTHLAVRNGLHHLIPARLHPVYQHYAIYFGGAVLLQRRHFQLLDGMSNAFWGWGLEDDEFRLRVKRNRLVVTTPSNVTMGLRAFRLIHNEILHRRDMRNHHKPLLRTLQGIPNVDSGLSSLKYTMVSRQWLVVDGVPALVFNVRLHCDTTREMCQQ